MMSKTQLNHNWDSINIPKYQEYPQRAKETTLLLLSIIILLIHISIFQILNLSPSTLLENNNFWFFISNLLILIIAADYGVFSSSKNNKHQDLYDEYVHVMHTQPRPHQGNEEQIKENSLSGSISQHHHLYDEYVHVMRTQPRPHQEDEEQIKEIVVWTEPKKEEKKKNLKSEEGGNRVEVEKGKKDIVCSWSSVREEKEEEEEEEEDEYAKMSNEEVNRRVEEFIRNFNTQIRLERAATFP